MEEDKSTKNEKVNNGEIFAYDIYNCCFNREEISRNLSRISRCNSIQL